ncbi:MAG: polysaccharide biosynthesis C-terminal domain-containing protein, partial [Bacteroidaceae bacterium]|nr:polysaccharide biosynthesis C-terminal domain-containing protein [Bacteroidaceae bacterium]
TVTNILVASLRSIGIVNIGYIISFSTLCINVCLNYLLIYGNFGFPELGVRGAAIATLVSRCVELLIVIYYLKFREKQLCLTLKKLVFIDTSYIRSRASLFMSHFFFCSSKNMGKNASASSGVRRACLVINSR